MKTRVGTSETHDRVISAALAVFTEHGFEAATTREIAARAGVNEVTLFRHFGTKRRLFEAVLEEATRDAETTKEYLDHLGTLPLREMLIETAFGFVTRHQARLPLIRIALLEQETASSLMTVPGASLRAALAQRFRQEQQLGAFRSDVDTDLVAFTLVSNFLGFVIGQVLRPEQPPPPVESFVRNYVDIFLRGVEPR